MESERNLVFETNRQPPGGSGAVIVYTEPAFRGRTVYLLTESDRWLKLMTESGLENPIRYQSAFSANVVPRMVNGQAGFSAWFPRVPVGEYVVTTLSIVRIKHELIPNEFYAVTTAFSGEVAEVDMRLG